MKEVFTKSFWQGVKKTFNDALEDPPPDSMTSEPPAADTPPTPDPPPASERAEEK